MANFKLPKTLGNKSFKGLMSGLANIDLIYQYNLANGIGFGTGFSYSYYELNGSVFQGSVLGQMEAYNPFLKISQRKEMNENIGVVQWKQTLHFLNIGQNIYSLL